MMGILDLDLGTVIRLLFVGNLAAMVAMLVYKAHHDPKSPDSFYIVSKLFQGLAWVFILCRGRISDLLSVYLGNLFLLAGFGLEALALCEADGRKGPWKLVFGILSGTGLLIFCLFGTSPGMRIFIASLGAVAIYSGLALGMLVPPSHRTGLHVFIGLASLGYSGIMGYRAVWGLGGGAPRDIMTPSLAQTLAFVPQYLSLLVGGMGFMLLTKERSDAAILESEDKYRTLVEKASEAIVIAQDGLFGFVNPRMAQLVGRSVDELKGTPFVDYVWPGDRTEVLTKHLARTVGGYAPEAYDFRIVGAGGKALWVSITATAIQWQGRPASLGLITDIDARKRQEEKIEALLRDKELLLREVHHRVKNNLSVAMSLLVLQSGEGGRRDPDEVLMDAHNRLHSMVELYERLNKVGDFESLSIRDYLPALAKDIVAVFPQGAKVEFALDLEDLLLDPQRLASLGIILNEMVTNSMKYAFDGVDEPRIAISMGSSESRVHLICADNGPGLPGGIDPARSQGFGIQLINMLAEQLHGSLRVEGGRGTVWHLEFPLEGG